MREEWILKLSKIFLLTSAVLASLTTFGITSKQCSHLLAPSVSNTQLFYYIESQSKAFSLNPLDVDSLSNDVLMRTLVGTLLRTDSSHRRVPNIAESWSNSLDSKIWHFQLRKDLSCQDGIPITADRFVRSLNMLMRLRAKSNPSVSAFSQLKGWAQFVKGDVPAIAGLTTAGPHTIQFEFEDSMDSGFLAFLSIPQFGFYCEANFGPGGEWAATDKFVSSSGFVLNSLSANGQMAKISRRTDWPLNRDRQPDEVQLQVVDRVDFQKLPSPNSFIVRGDSQKSDIPGDYRVMTGAMNWLRSLVVSPFMANIFKDQHNRQVFLNRLRQWARVHDLKIPLTNATERFYPTDKPSKIKIEQPSQYINLPKNGGVLKLVYSAPLEVLNHYLPGIEAALIGTGLKLEIHKVDRAHADGVRKFLSNRDYDLRLISSSIGGGISNWIVDMMFCSNLGVCFPDEGGRICKLVRVQKVNPIAEVVYSENFDRILGEEATVIPLHHTGSMWVFGPNLSSEGVSPVSPVPGVEQLTLQ